jgi:hypothetical protein
MLSRCDMLRTRPVAFRTNSVSDDPGGEPTTDESALGAVAALLSIPLLCPVALMVADKRPDRRINGADTLDELQRECIKSVSCCRVHRAWPVSRTGRLPTTPGYVFEHAITHDFRELPRPGMRKSPFELP